MSSETISMMRLRDIFSSDRWREHVATLTENLHFTFSVYQDQSTPLFPAPMENPFCAPLIASNAQNQGCSEACRKMIDDVLKTGERRVFSCPEHIMNFTLPIDHLGERIVISGRGSFQSHEDYIAYMSELRTHDPSAAAALASSLVFTTEYDALGASVMAERMIRMLLQNVEESITLQKKVVDMKEVMGWWGVTGESDDAAIYGRLVKSLKVLFDLKRVFVSTWNKHDERYLPVVPLSGGTDHEGLIFTSDDRLIQDLRSKGTYVLSTDPELLATAGVKSAAGALYLFPVRVHREMEGVLAVSNGIFSEGDIQIVQGLCRQTSLHIENHRLQRNVFEKFNLFSAITDMSREISTIKNYEHLLQTILEKSAHLLMAEQGSLMMVDRDTDALLLEARKGARAAQHEKMPKGEGISGRVAAQGEPLLVEDVEHDPRVLQKNRSHYKTPSCISVPLKIGDQMIGVLNLADKITGKVFDQDDLQVIQSFAAYAAVVLERNTLHRQAERLKTLSITDPLTGLLNRRYFQERLEEELVRAERHRRSMSLLMLDVDGFKKLNDTLGHPAGDRALKLVAENLVKSVRTIDIIARYGGDEFVVILPETDVHTTFHVAERIRSDIQAGKYALQGDSERSSLPVTVSIGIAAYPDHGTSSEILLARADKALYEAKALGKNRIELYR